MDLAELQNKTNEELSEIAAGMGVTEGASPPKRQELLMKVLQASAEQNGHILASGILAIVNDGYGVLRQNGTTHSTTMSTCRSPRSEDSLCVQVTRWPAR